MGWQRDKALYQQVAAHLRRELVGRTAVGEYLPPDAELARRHGVSVRTVREALLLLEAEGRVARQQGRGTVVCRPALPVALYSELNLLHPQTPRFFGLVFEVMRQRLAAAGYASRLYTGRSAPGDPSGPFTCPELLADAQAWRLAGIAATTSALDTPELQQLRHEGLPMVPMTEESRVFPAGPGELVRLAVQYLAARGRERLALIGWGAAKAGSDRGLEPAFREALAVHGLPWRHDWCRVDFSFACAGAGWEEFREIWFAADDKPDALVIADENYLPDVSMAILQLGIRVPDELLLVSHQTRHVRWQSPLPVALVEEDVDAFAERLALKVLAAIDGRPLPELPPDASPYRLVPLSRSPAMSPPTARNRKP